MLYCCFPSCFINENSREKDAFSRNKKSVPVGVGEDLSFYDIEKGHYDILLSSPETFLGKYRNAVAVLAKENLLGATFIDEAHYFWRL